MNSSAARLPVLLCVRDAPGGGRAPCTRTLVRFAPCVGRVGVGVLVCLLAAYRTCCPSLGCTLALLGNHELSIAQEACLGLAMFLPPRPARDSSKSMFIQSDSLFNAK